MARPNGSYKQEWLHARGRNEPQTLAPQRYHALKRPAGPRVQTKPIFPASHEPNVAFQFHCHSFPLRIRALRIEPQGIICGEAKCNPRNSIQERIGPLRCGVVFFSTVQGRCPGPESNGESG